jgi:hypothetical protein
MLLLYCVRLPRKIFETRAALTALAANEVVFVPAGPRKRNRGKRLRAKSRAKRPDSLVHGRMGFQISTMTRCTPVSNKLLFYPR